MNKIYVPNTSHICYVVIDKDTIRGYDDDLIDDTDINYTDYYINSHYISKNGVEHYTDDKNYSCITDSYLTDVYYYRNDFTEILIMFCIVGTLCIGVPLFIFRKLFKKRW